MSHQSSFLCSLGMSSSCNGWYLATVLGTNAMEGIKALNAKSLVFQAAPSPSDLLPDPFLEAEVMGGGWRRVGSQVSKVRLLNSWFQVKILLCVKKPATLCFPFSFTERKKCKECKNSPENRLSGFLKELSWGSKQPGGSEDEVMTDGISGAWHNSPIWWSYPALYEC